MVAYFAILGILSLYGIHRFYLVGLFWKTRHRQPRPGRLPETPPRLTVQLPIYNEFYVVERLIRAACRIDYPSDRLDIQVLDDSTDETSNVARRLVDEYRRRGVAIEYRHRVDRKGFKAGALQAGMETARGEFIAIFDADFIPTADFARKMIPYLADPRIGMVQARWGHLNRDYSLLTRIQAIFLDGHFVIEHGARNRGGMFFNFNGTAGILRRSCIEAAGGWQHDTLTEDLDLSYRAQMRGWKFLFLPDVVAPAELPVEMAAFRSQQYRWAKGSIQTARKLLPAILAEKLPLRVKLEAIVHLTSNFAYPLMILLSLLLYPSIRIRGHAAEPLMLLIDLPLFLFASLSVMTFYSVSQSQTGPGWQRRLVYLPAVMSIGIGLAWNNTLAVLTAIFGTDTEFHRTPKFRIEKPTDDWARKRYRSRPSPAPLLEFLFTLIFIAALVDAIRLELFASLPFLLLFLSGFSYTSLLSFGQWARNPKNGDIFLLWKSFRKRAVPRLSKN